jgi:predicted nucleotide-binding protein
LIAVSRNNGAMTTSFSFKAMPPTQELLEELADAARACTLRWYEGIKANGDESQLQFWGSPISEVQADGGDSGLLPSVTVKLTNVEIGPRRTSEYGSEFYYPRENKMSYVTDIGASAFDIAVGHSMIACVSVDFRSFVTLVSVPQAMGATTSWSYGITDFEDEIEAIFIRAEERQEVKSLEEMRAANPPVESFVYEPPPFRVFLGHGGDDQWRILRDQLRDDHGFEVKAFEGEPRAGFTIESVLSAMSGESTVAVIVMTEADLMASGVMRARQNVVHEIGYFQGRLGWSNTIVLMEGMVEEFSNLAGTQHIKFPKGNIGSAVGALIAALNKRRQ